MSHTTRKPYSKSKAFDATCRNHGSCGWCEGNRTRAARRAEMAAESDLSEDMQERVDRLMHKYDTEFRRLADC